MDVQLVQWSTKWDYITSLLDLIELQYIQNNFKFRTKNYMLNLWFAGERRALNKQLNFNFFYD